MKKEKLLNICKGIQRFTLLLGTLTIVLPIAFWGKIPDTIPMHYGATGAADSYSDKNSLILLFFVVALLMGVMSIVIFYVKTSASSKYATEAEKSQMNTVYPSIIFMNLIIQGMFSYIMFCCVTSRNLGVWFLPVFLIFVFAPIIWCIYKSGRISYDPATTLGRYKLAEKQEKGIVYRSKVDWWLGLLLGGSMVWMICMTIWPIAKGEGIDWIITVSTIFTLLTILPLAAIKYVLYSDHLYVSGGIYGKVRVPYKAICGMKETHNPISSAALSVDRIQIDYVENGISRMVLISPRRKKEFMKKINEKTTFS